MLILALVAVAAATAPRCFWQCDEPFSTCIAKFPPTQCRARGCNDANCEKYVSVREVPNEQDPEGCPAGEVLVRPPSTGACSIANGCTYECEMLDRGWWECPPPPLQQCQYACEHTTCAASNIDQQPGGGDYTDLMIVFCSVAAFITIVFTMTALK